MKTNAKLYTEKEVRRLFDSFAILIGERDAVPKQTAVGLFGKDALCFTNRLNSDSRYSGLIAGFGIGQHTVFGLTLRGMKIAATYCKVLALSEGGITEDAYSEE